jgi:hypothetical protein
LFLLPKQFTADFETSAPWRKSMRIFITLAFISGLLAPCVYAQPTAPGSALTSQAIDPSLFREGAVRRFSGQAAAWTYVCDEVPQLKQRFCSLRSMIKDNTGAAIARITVSTGENGRPAALLEMAQSELTETGIEITLRPVAPKADPKGAAKAKAAVPYRVFSAACAKGTCQLIWTLPPDHVAALNSGSGLKIRYQRPGAAASSLAAALKPGAPATNEAIIDATGFAAAVDASVKPSQ